MNADLDALATALYVIIDDWLMANPDLVPRRPAVGIAPRLADAELLTMAVLQALLGFANEARWIRYAHQHLGALFPYVPARAGYNKRLRHATSMMSGVMRMIAMRCASWHDDVWLIDSTPVECGRSRETAKRSDLAGWAGYGWVLLVAFPVLLGLATASHRHAVGAAHRLRPLQPQDRRTRGCP